MTPDDDRQKQFQRYVENKDVYNEDIRAKDAKPWFERVDKRKKLAGILGIAEDSPELDFRRALFNRRWTRPEPPSSMPALTLSKIRGSR